METTNFTLNEKLLGNPSTIYKTIATQTITEAANELSAAMSALDPNFEGINTIEMNKKALIEWYQSTAKLYDELKAKPKASKKAPEKKAEKKAPKKEKVGLKKGASGDAEGRYKKYSIELSEKEVELKTLNETETPDKAAIKVVTKRIASLHRKLKRAQTAMAANVPAAENEANS